MKFYQTNADKYRQKIKSKQQQIHAKIKQISQPKQQHIQREFLQCIITNKNGKLYKENDSIFNGNSC